MPVTLPPPFTVTGLTVNELSSGGLTIKVALTVDPFREPETATNVVEPTGLVVITKLTDWAFWAIVTVAGTVAAAVLPLVRVTLMPPAGALTGIIKIPVAVVPPVTDGFTKERLCRVIGATLSCWDKVIVPKLAVMLVD